MTAVLGVGAQKADCAPRRPFTVRDSVEWTHVLSLESDSTPTVALFSPDGAHFVIRTRTGAISENAVRETLLVFDTGEVESYLVGGGVKRDPPKPVALITIDGHKSDDAVRNVQWSDNTNLAFIAADNNDAEQAYQASVNTSRVAKLTHSDTSVAAFAAAANGVLYFAHRRHDAPLYMFAVGDRALADVLALGDAREEPLRLMWQPVGSDVAMPIDQPDVNLLENFRNN